MYKRQIYKCMWSLTSQSCFILSPQSVSLKMRFFFIDSKLFVALLNLARFDVYSNCLLFRHFLHAFHYRTTILAVFSVRIVCRATSFLNGIYLYQNSSIKGFFSGKDNWSMLNFIQHQQFFIQNLYRLPYISIHR